MRVCWSPFINTCFNKEIIRLLSGGAGFYREPEDSKNIGN